MPEEVTEEESEDGPTKPAEGLGLGEGEGEKDVSDRLESEDQLEGARQAGQEKEDPADKDIQVRICICTMYYSYHFLYANPTKKIAILLLAGKNCKVIIKVFSQ
jgi:hypothetical protein